MKRMDGTQERKSVVCGRTVERRFLARRTWAGEKSGLFEQPEVILASKLYGKLQPYCVPVLRPCSGRGAYRTVSRGDCTISSLDWARDPEQAEGRRTVMKSARQLTTDRAEL